MGIFRSFKTEKLWEEHFEKHVMGKCNSYRDLRSKDKREFEKQLWEKEEVKNRDEYLRKANENTEEGNYKRHYMYWSVRKQSNEPIVTKSSNYQRGDVYYKEDISEDEASGLLTTCLDDNETRITSCFFRTMNYNNVELLTMAISIYYCATRDRFIEKTDSKIYIPGLNLNTFSKELRDTFEELYEDSYFKVSIMYNKKIATQKILIDFLSKKIKKTNQSYINYLKSCCDVFCEALKNEKTNETEIKAVEKHYVDKIKADILDVEQEFPKASEMFKELKELIENNFDDFFAGFNLYQEEGSIIFRYLMELYTIREGDYFKD